MNNNNFASPLVHSAITRGVHSRCTATACQSANKKNIKTSNVKNLLRVLNSILRKRHPYKRRIKSSRNIWPSFRKKFASFRAPLIPHPNRSVATTRIPFFHLHGWSPPYQNKASSAGTDCLPNSVMDRFFVSRSQMLKAFKKLIQQHAGESSAGTACLPNSIMDRFFLLRSLYCISC